ncbi:MAG: hypothetical protein KC560_20280, partial [Myxococcales bacterium]|nr:hypothetical protein [Myxococcales bacterium]
TAFAGTRARCAGARLLPALVAMALVATAPAAARATPTDPVLAIYAARAARGDARTRIQLAAVFPQQDLVQIPYPIQVVVWDGVGGAQYVRFDLSDGAFEGSHAGLADGLDPADATALASAGAPSATARHVLVAKGRIELELSTAFPLADARVRIFVIEGGSPVLSNEMPVDVVLDAQPGGGS